VVIWEIPDVDKNKAPMRVRPMEEIKRSVCALDCPDCCSLLVTVRDGKVVKVTGDPDHPYTQGFICKKVELYPKRLYSRFRISSPMRRIGKKGEGRFEPITWDEALDEITSRFREIIQSWGGEAILPYSHTGTMGLIHMNFPQRFFHRIGASRLDRTICIGSAYEGWSVTVGKVIGNDTETIPESDFIILWGCNAVSTNIHLIPMLKEARRRGAHILYIDPYVNRTARFADEHLMIRPGTDAALALALMHVLVEEGLVDQDFIDRYTLGFEAFKVRLGEYPPERAARITGIPSETIRDLAQRYGRARAPFIRIGIGTSRHTNGGMAVRTMACLPGLVAAYHKRGGGAFVSSDDAFPLDWGIVGRPDLQPGDSGAWIPHEVVLGGKYYPDFEPKRTSTRLLNMCRLGEALLEVEDPPVKALFVYSSNPAAIAPQSAKVIEGLKREDLFTVVHDVVLTDTVDYADIVLPAPTFLETEDLYFSYGQYYLQRATPAVQPLGEAKSNWELFSLLAKKMGFEEAVFQEGTEKIIEDLVDNDLCREMGIGKNELSDFRSHRVGFPRDENPFKDGFFTPSGKLEFYSETLAQAGLDPLPDHVPLAEGSETPALLKKYPLQLIVPPAHHFLNSCFGEVEDLISAERKPYLFIHPEDAVSRGIEEGDLVRVFNDRGENFRFAKLGERTLPGVTVTEGIWWAKLSPGQKGTNQLTSERLTDLGRAATLHSNLVEVEKVEPDVAEALLEGFQQGTV